MENKNTENKKILGYHSSTISLFKTGGRKVSWPLAVKLCDLFPGKSIKEWKVATPAEVANAFEQIEKRIENVTD